MQQGKSFLKSIFLFAVIFSFLGSAIPAFGAPIFTPQTPWIQNDWSGGSGVTSWQGNPNYNTQGGDGVLDVVPNQITKLNSANIVLGQTDLTSYAVNQNLDTDATRLYNPSDSIVVNGKLIVSDTYNNRVLIYNTIPTSNDAAADVVIGQTNMLVGSSVTSPVSAYTLSDPSFLASDGTKLFISDSGNNRVLIYNTIPTTNGAAANVVIGQADFVSHLSNQGGSVAANTLYAPQGMYTDGTKLYIADRSNNRVLIYNTVPVVNNASADLVVGQPDLVSSTCNQTARGANTLCSPVAVYSDGTNLFIADAANNRVLIYNTIPTANDASANVVVGQADFVTGVPGTTAANTLNNPGDIYSDGTKLFIVDLNHNRVLIYNTIPTANDASANVVIGQADFVTASENQSNPHASAYSMSVPEGIYSDGTKLYVSDLGNSRVLIFNTIPTANDVSADVVVGQTNFIANGTDQGGMGGADTAHSPNGVFSDGTRLYIADTLNNRVLIYNTIPTATDASADVVVGQPNLTQVAQNQGMNPGANTLNAPTAVYSDGTRLFIVDAGNNRVLIYNTIPTTNDASANVVIGQPDFISSTANQGGSQAANTLSLYNRLCNLFTHRCTVISSDGIFVSGGKLFIPDTLNNRVLVYNAIPTANNTSADFVIGQQDLISNDNCGTVDEYTMCYPSAVVSDGTKLYVSDSQNNRVLVYNTIPTANDAAADAVIGQPDFVSYSADQGGSSGINTLYYPTALWVYGQKLYIADNQNSRVLIYNTNSLSTNMDADGVVGQADFSYTSADQGGSVAANGLNLPNGIYVDNHGLFISDTNNNRTLIFSGHHSSDLVSSTYDSGTSYTVWGPLTYTGTTPANTNLAFAVSTDGGSTWQNVNNYSTQTFGPSQTLAYKATLSTSDGVSTPVINSVNIPYVTIAGATSSGGGSGISSELPLATPSPSVSPTPIPSPSQGGAPTPTPSAQGGAPTPTPSATTSASGSPQPSISLPSVMLIPSTCSFTKNLYFGMIDAEVHCLQVFLNINGYVLSSRGFGSLHNETNYFGPLTLAALRKFQQDHHINPAAGYFGPITRGVIENLTK